MEKVSLINNVLDVATGCPQLLGPTPMISKGGTRPSIPEYPQIAESVKEALDAVYYGMKSPQEALDDAAEKSAKALGW